jgi:hypothetical protein
MAPHGKNIGINVPALGEAHPNVIIAFQQIINKLGRLAGPEFKNVTLTDMADAGAGFVKNDATGLMTGGNSIEVADLPAHATTHESGGTDTVDHDSLVNTHQGVDTGDTPTFAGLTSTAVVDASAGEVLVEDAGVTAPTGKGDGYVGAAYVDSNGRLYFFVEGTRYYVNGIADAGLTGSPMGLLLTITYT